MLPLEREIAERLEEKGRSPTDAELDALQRTHYLRVLMEHTSPVLLEAERATPPQQGEGSDGE